MEIPSQLHTAIENQLASQLPSVKRLAELSSELSDSYRTGMPLGGGTYLRSYQDILAYAAFRLPATFAAVYSAVCQARERLPGLKPNSLLDVGAGPGTAMWAVSTIWPDLESITLLEREQHMIELGNRLVAYSDLPCMRRAKWLKHDITEEWYVAPHDLVIAAYVLNELTQYDRAAFVQRLWQNTANTLIIIEPGTPAGFLRIRQAREELLSAGAKTIAPCPHDKPCPMDGNDWCHFSQRVARTRLHRQVKCGKLSYEDEKFSFVCVSRTGGAAIGGLVIRHPQIRKGHIQLELCTPEGLTNTVVTRKNKEMFRKARKLRWGSILWS